MTRAEESAEHANVIEGTFRVVETLRGQPPSNNKVLTTVFVGGGCGMLFLAGADYAFFLSEGRENFVQIGEGSIGPFNATDLHGRRLLGELRALVK
jgi:hypothetical protein